MAVARVMELHVVAMKLHVANTRLCWFTDNQNVVHKLQVERYCIRTVRNASNILRARMYTKEEKSVGRLCMPNYLLC